MTLPSISVVVPTIDRCGSLMRLLRALAGQIEFDQRFDVIIVVDGAASDALRAIPEGGWPFPVQVVDQPASGAAAARNHGAALARGDVLLFLDDDIEPDPGVLRAHAALHEQRRRAIGLGHLLPAIAQPGYFGVILRGWADAMTDGPREPGHRHVYNDLLSGHFSVAAETFAQLGGFDTQFRCHEDYELGYRAIAAGCELCFIPEAVSRHHDASDLSKVFQRKLDEGVADVQLAERYPELTPSLPLARPMSPARLPRILSELAWRHPAIGEATAAFLSARLLPVYERLHLRFRWRHLLESLLVFWYWRGVAGRAGGRARLDALRAAASPLEESAITIDLDDGLAAAEQRLDLHLPRTARIIWGDCLVGEVPDVPGAERLRGAHLRRILARQLAREYLQAAATKKAMPELLSARALELMVSEDLAEAAALPQAPVAA